MPASRAKCTFSSTNVRDHVRDQRPFALSGVPQRPSAFTGNVCRLRSALVLLKDIAAEVVTICQETRVARIADLAFVSLGSACLEGPKDELVGRQVL